MGNLRQGVRFDDYARMPRLLPAGRGEILMSYYISLLSLWWFFTLHQIIGTAGNDGCRPLQILKGAGSLLVLSR